MAENGLWVVGGAGAKTKAAHMDWRTFAGPDGCVEPVSFSNVRLCRNPEVCVQFVTGSASRNAILQMFKSLRKAAEEVFPEPDGVTFVQENIPWVPLERKYKPWGINDPVRIYHKEGNDHLSGKSKKITKQDFRNKIWNAAHMLNNYRTYDLSFKKRMEMILRYRAYIHILKRYKDHEFVKKNRLKRPTNNVISMAVGIPSITIAKVYEKRLK